MDAVINQQLESILSTLRGAPLAEANKSKNAPNPARQLEDFLSDIVSAVCTKLQCDGDEGLEDAAVELVITVLAEMEDNGKLPAIPDTDTAAPEEISLWLATAQQLQVGAAVQQAADEILAELDAEDANEWDNEEWDE